MWRVVRVMVLREGLGDRAMLEGSASNGGA
jgi:hypothetical protein